jgi:hypothetical protein
MAPVSTSNQTTQQTLSQPQPQPVIIQTSWIQNIGDIGTTIITAGIIIFTIIAWVKGWFRMLNAYKQLATKANLFIDNILPQILGHGCQTHRLPKDLLSTWTTALSSMGTGLVTARSPMTITPQGYQVIK